MKGGITSGVVYPLAAVELSKRYQFKNVGGTSAGAIAAAATAAAEHGRSTGQGTGFAELETLPAWLGANLTELFQPSKPTRPLFRILLGTSAANTPAGKLLGALRAALAGFPLPALLGAIPGLALGLVAATSGSGFLLVWGIVCGIVLAVAGLALGLGLAVIRRVTVAVPANYFGLMTGHADEPQGEIPPLTTWLTDLFDRLAGKEGEEALTFGDLWGASDPRSARDINLEMMSTCLTNGRPYRLPFSTHEFWFDPGELRDFFPAAVVDQMIRHARPDARSERFAPLLPLPEPASLPVVVATRMSLSFPLLISAVPLHAVDYSLPLPERARRPEPCWFSDGGITSNFPVHFFDSPVPRWPTFAINLRDYPRDRTPSPDQTENIWMPGDNSSQGTGHWTVWGTRSSLGQLIAFGGTILKTMQNWVDNNQSDVPGYRDRVVHIFHTHREGGMNLKMPPEAIAHLSQRGEAAGALLSRRFAVPPEDPSAIGWDNQRWIRYRSFMHVLEQTLEKLEQGYVGQEPGDRSIEDLSRRAHEQPPGYHWVSRDQCEFALAGSAALAALIQKWRTSGHSYAPGAPTPAPELRVMPRS
jgi:predicted acylesterase/phospholipase RssA